MSFYIRLKKKLPVEYTFCIWFNDQGDGLTIRLDKTSLII
jgi:hypothetical protein